MHEGCLWGAMVKGFVLLVAAGVAAIVGVLVGVVPVSVRDQGEVIACGPALFGDGGRLADLACSTVQQPLQTLTVTLLVAAGIMIVFGFLALRAEPVEVAPEVQRVPSTI
jgi:zinc transporter ZupT